MTDDQSDWSANSREPGGQLAPLAPLAQGTQVGERDAGGRFLSGNIGGGRKKGSRNRLTETFLAAIENDFAEHGPEALETLRGSDPATYLRIVASLVPRDLILRREQESDFSEMSDEEVNRLYGRAFRNGKIRRDLAELSR